MNLGIKSFKRSSNFFLFSGKVLLTRSYFGPKTSIPDTLGLLAIRSIVFLAIFKYEEIVIEEGLPFLILFFVVV